VSINCGSLPFGELSSLQPTEFIGHSVQVLSAPLAPENPLGWFALHVQSGRERHLATVLAKKSYETYVPEFLNKRRVRGIPTERMVALFPGYLFLRMDPLYRLPILTTPGVFAIVGAYNSHLPAPIELKELEAVRAMVASGREVTPVPYLPVGQRVRIENGPMCGYGTEGILLRWRGKDRLVVSITLLGRSISVEIDRGSALPVFETTPMTPHKLSPQSLSR